MPTPTKGTRLGGSPAHQRLILANLATSLFEHGAITTTETKARRLRPLAEKLITKAKRGDLNHRRQVAAVIRDKGIVHELFTEIAPRYATRPGGYTRITKIGPRKGDNAPMAVIELVEEVDFTAKTTTSKQTAPAAAPVAETEPTPAPVEEEQSTASDEETTESTQVEEGAREEEAAEADSTDDARSDESASDESGSEDPKSDKA